MFGTLRWWRWWRRASALLVVSMTMTVVMVMVVMVSVVPFALLLASFSTLRSLAIPNLTLHLPVSFSLAFAAHNWHNLSRRPR